MKSIFLVFFILLASCSSIDKPLQKAMAYGEMQELNQLSSQIDKQLLLRIYSVPLYKEGCFNETQGICQYQYFITVSTFDEHPETNIYPLKAQGNIKRIEWLPSEELDTAIIEVEIEEFTEAAVKNNPTLTLNKNIFQVAITPKKITESLILPVF